jgi:hypothetical protein
MVRNENTLLGCLYSCKKSLCATAAGDLVPSPEEEAEQAVVRVEAAEARAERLAERLRSLGVEPDL